MNVVDSSGWVEYFQEGKNAKFFTAPIQDLENLLVPSICIYEVFKRIFQELGEENALQAVGIMCAGREVELDRKISIDAAKISIDLKLAMADSIILASAHAYEATLWTQDAHFKDVDGIRYIEK
ncbi:MAG: type II toxin-antitoxin system VapC family toxin [Chloroflexota bacterium]